MYWTNFNYNSGVSEQPKELNEIFVLRNVLEPKLHASLLTYTKALKDDKENQLRHDDLWGGRWTKNNDPIMCFVHNLITPVVYSKLKIPVKPSYNFLSCYEDKGIVPKHTDRPQCAYTFDYMIDHTPGLKWELFVEKTPIVLGPNDAVVYSGTDMLHWRDQIPDGNFAHLAFFHFVSSSFSTSLD